MVLEKKRDQYDKYVAIEDITQLLLLNPAMFQNILPNTDYRNE